MTQLKPCRDLLRNTAAGTLATAPTRWKAALFVALMVGALPLFARGKDATQYGMGLIVNLPYPENEVTQVVQEIIQNGMIRGTKEYAKDEFISGATAVSTTKVFPEWTEGGKVFYKVRFKALDPRNFKDGNDVGTLAVRYVVQAQDDKHTVLHIDARYVEDFRHIAHASNGSVESAEYKDIHDHLDSIELVKTETAEALKVKLEPTAGTPNVPLKDEPPTPRVAPAPPVQTIVPVEVPPAEETQPAGPPKTLQERVRSSPASATAREGARGAAEVCPLPLRGDVAISARRNRSTYRNFDNVLAGR
jgi:hypothetical protein